MSKIVEATCESGVVKVMGLTISDAVIYSKGVANSTGVLIIDGAQSFYLASSALDLETTLTKLITALDKTSMAFIKVGTTLTAIGAGMTGPTTAPPPTLVSDVLDINAKATDIATAKTELTTLKGGLI